MVSRDRARFSNFNLGDAKYLCRRAKLPRKGVHNGMVRERGRDGQLHNKINTIVGL